jgi:hypothetical protein
MHVRRFWAVAAGGFLVVFAVMSVLTFWAARGSIMSFRTTGAAAPDVYKVWFGVNTDISQPPCTYMARLVVTVVPQ